MQQYLRDAGARALQSEEVRVDLYAEDATGASPLIVRKNYLASLASVYPAVCSTIFMSIRWPPGGQ